MTQLETETEQSTKPKPPSQLRYATWLWLTIALVGAVQSVIQVADRQELIRRVKRISPELSQEEVDIAANGEVMLTLLVALLSFLCYLLFSRRMLEGRNWARIVLAVFGGLNALGTVFTLTAVWVLGIGLVQRLTQVTVNPTDLVFASLTLVLGCVALVLMFHKDANRFFRETRPAPRRMDRR